jgi:hypothetical protein
LCKHCNIAEETLQHKYIECTKNNNIYESILMWLNENFNTNFQYDKTDFITGKPKRLNEIEPIFERTLIELKYYIHIKTKAILENKSVFLNSLDFIFHLLAHIRECKYLYNIKYVNRTWGKLANLVT